MALRDLIQLWDKIVTSEIPEAILAITAVNKLLENPKWGDIEWWATFGDSLVTAIDEAVDVTKTEQDDFVVEKIKAIRPKIRNIRIAVMDLIDELNQQFEVCDEP